MKLIGGSVNQEFPDFPLKIFPNSNSRISLLVTHLLFPSNKQRNLHCQAAINLAVVKQGMDAESNLSPYFFNKSKSTKSCPRPVFPLFFISSYNPIKKTVSFPYVI